MADDSRPVSSVLFCKEDGEAVKFFLRPSETKARLKPLIEEGGGVVSSKLSASQDWIKLAAEGDKISSDDYFTAVYIDDCIAANQLLPMDKYRFKQQQQGQPRPPSPAHSVMSNVSVIGRRKYDSTEDAAIIKYIAKHPECSYSGNMIWKKMELLKVTDHSWQSMKHRFLRKLVDDLPGFLKSQKERAKHAASSSSKSEGSDAEDGEKLRVVDDPSGCIKSHRERAKNAASSSSKSEGSDAEDGKKLRVVDDPSGCIKSHEERAKNAASSSSKSEGSDAEDGKKLRVVDDPSGCIKSHRERAKNAASSSSKSEGSDAEDGVNKQETPQKTPSREQNPPVVIAADGYSGDSESSQKTPREGPSQEEEYQENSNGSDSDFDIFLIEAAEQNTVEKVSQNGTGGPSGPAGEVNMATSDDTSDGEIHSTKRRKKNMFLDSDSEELVAGFLTDSDSRTLGLLSEVEQAHEEGVREIVTFVKEAMKEYSVSAKSVVQLLYLHSGDFDAATDHLQTGERREGQPLWTTEDDEKLNSPNPKDINKLCKKHGQVAVMKRQAFFD